MKNGDILIGAVDNEKLITPGGRILTISDVAILRQDRVSSGKLRSDIIATKKKFSLAYSFIDNSELSVFLDLYDLNTELSMLIYFADDETTPGPLPNYDQYIVLMDAIERTRLTVDLDGIWSGVTCVFNEV